MNHLDLFSGIGGFALAAKWVWGDEHNIVSFVETDKICQKVLKKHWPNIPIHDDIKDFKNGNSAEIITGGDPCPIRSRARALHNSAKHSDLSGYFLAVVGRCRPRWVLRENVPAPDDKDFSTSLEVLGYRTVIIRTNAAPFTGQTRIRDIIVGCIKKTWLRKFELNFKHDCDSRYYPPRLASRPFIPCLTTHTHRYDTRDCYIFDGKLRILDSDERAKFTGLPDKWLDGLSKSAIGRVTGNAIVPQVVVPIMQAIKEIEGEECLSKN